MVSFSHHEAGTSERIWAQNGWSAAAGPLVLTDCARLIVLAAHPDDETLGAGGLITAAAGRGIPVTVVVATNGEASHPHSPTHTPDDLAAIRRVEVVTAVHALAPDARVRLLDLPDGDLTQHHNSLEEALWDEAMTDQTGGGSDRETADAAGAETAAGATSASTWLVAPWRQDGHPDHAVAGTAAAMVARRTGARLLEYPIWAWHWSTPDDEIWPGDADPITRWRWDLDGTALEHKRIALAAHGSQVEPLSDRPGDEAIVSPGFAAHFDRDHETFLGAAVDTDAATNTDTGPTVAGSAGESLTAGFFEDFYAGSVDPWGFETRWYEARKRAATLAALPLARYGDALELGCSIGVLSRELAERSDTLLATDINEQALAVARDRLADLPGVTVERRVLPAEWPAGTFDLVVLSEIGYYCSPADLAVLLENCRASLRPGGTLVACHWRHPVGEYPLGGDDVHAALAALPGLDRTVRHLERDFVLEVYEPQPAPSVAQREGLA
ncbi:bifunctional PIG-L family deacetylase/class I SAM-dependent methyltransferase [Cryobacterium sp. 1639]|uniref:PIG-L family deacetylase n=1 Tax=Cryobacterium inferilacus TaxID=2866629 RepID=UPI001C72DF3C|nr:PIG-L family deacetylase [Cryobacterium sp. 1639]MBX0300720.1 bifunctional PIG-L family deacetylase/class I SAM-dependent methyltransferase [Cryobacterium sp. 1639]